MTEQTLQQRAEALLADYPPGKAYDYPLCDYIYVTSDLLAENARLRARLEIDSTTDGEGNRVPHPAPEIDGIACRDETIKLLDEKVIRLECRNKSLRKTNASLRGHNRAYKTLLRNVVPKRWKKKDLDALLERMAP